MPARSKSWILIVLVGPILALGHARAALAASAQDATNGNTLTTESTSFSEDRTIFKLRFEGPDGELVTRTEIGFARAGDSGVVTGISTRSGEFVVFVGIGGEIYGQRVDSATGGLIGPSVLLTDPNDPRVPGAISGRAQWSDVHDGWRFLYACFGGADESLTEVCGQKTDAELNPIGPVIDVSDPDDGRDATRPAINILPNGNVGVFYFEDLESIVAQERSAETLELVSSVTTPLPDNVFLPRDLTVGCFEDIGNPVPGERNACADGQVFLAFSHEGSKCSEETEVLIGSLDWDADDPEVDFFTRGGFCNELRNRFLRVTDVACNAWARTCGVGTCVSETRTGEPYFCVKNTFTQDADGSLVVSEPLILGEGQDLSIVPLHLSPGSGLNRVAGDLLSFLDVDDGEGGVEVVPIPLTVPCVDQDRTICLNDDQYRIHASFNTAAGSGVGVGAAADVRQGSAAVGNTVELTSDTGYFWFFDEDNVEVVVKVLDACGVNGQRWVFAAGLTSVAVDLTVKSQSGLVREYHNPLDVPYQPVLDTSAFPCSEEEIRRAREEEWAARPFEELEEALELLAARSGRSLRREGAAGACAASDETLCLTADRFRVEATFRAQDGNEGTARTVELTNDTGYFWFFDEDNVEVVLKVLDACALNDNFWFFAAGLTNVEVEITVTDTVLGTERTFANPLGTPFAPIQETSVLPCG